MGAQAGRQSGGSVHSRELAEGIVPWDSWKDLMEACNSVTFAIRGDRVGREEAGEERPRVSWGDSLLRNRFAASCCRGNKSAGVPNQDSFFFLELTGGDFVLGVMDGHGEWGHKYSEFISWWMPVLVVRSPTFSSDVPESLMGAFAGMSELLTKQVSAHLSMEQMSGSTCIVIVKRGATLYAAYLGDSRAVVFGTNSSHHLTEDHKPNKVIESARITSQGGRVVDLGSTFGGPRLMDSDGSVGLAVSRAFGDTKVQQLGLSDEPDLRIYPLDLGTPYAVVTGSDGLWDHITVEEVRDLVWDDEAGQPRDCETTVKSCEAEARRRWIHQSRTNYVDDITCAMVDFSCGLLTCGAERRRTRRATSMAEVDGSREALQQKRTESSNGSVDHAEEVVGSREVRQQEPTESSGGEEAVGSREVRQQEQSEFSDGEEDCDEEDELAEEVIIEEGEEEEEGAEADEAVEPELLERDDSMESRSESLQESSDNTLQPQAPQSILHAANDTSLEQSLSMVNGSTASKAQEETPALFRLPSKTSITSDGSSIFSGDANFERPKRPSTAPQALLPIRTSSGRVGDTRGDSRDTP